MTTHILILRPGAIGDTLLTFPLLRALKTRHEQTYIMFVSNPAVLPLASLFGLADAVSDYGAMEWSQLFSPSGIRAPFLRDIMQHTNRAICWIHDPDAVVQHTLSSTGIHDIVIAPGRPTDTSGLHVLTYLAQTIGITLTEQERSQAFSPGPFDDAQGIALHAGSGGVSKCWPLARFAEIIMMLWQQRIPVLLLAGPADTERFSMLMQCIGTPPVPSLLKTVVNAPLIEVAQHLRQYKVYLGNDSGITHLAALLGTPTIVLFGPSSPTMWKPVGPHVSVLQTPDLKDLSVEIVMDTIMLSMNT